MSLLLGVMFFLEMKKKQLFCENIVQKLGKIIARWKIEHVGVKLFGHSLNWAQP